MPPMPRAVVVTFDRETFLHEVWDYKPGDHVTFLAPTQCGKTTLAFQLLGVTASEDLQACVFVMKPRDAVVTKFGQRFKFHTVRDWPPPVIHRWMRKPPGYLLWPLETGDPDADDARHYMIFRRAIRMIYSSGKGTRRKPGKKNIIFADETYSLEKELGLEVDLRRVWSKGSSMECGLWAGTQRPVFISRWSFQAQHLFLSKDPDKDMQKRYGEIGAGIDSDIVRDLVSRLEQYQFVYINREERSMCIVDR